MKMTSLFAALLLAYAGVVTIISTPSMAAQGQGRAVISVTGTLPAEEATDLQFMREEEKLAHDVYAALYVKWKLPAFDNIRSSEATHMSALLDLLTGYQLVDPVASKKAGEFANPVLQKLYTDLVTKGSQSLIAALQVGAEIEELDIKDLQDRKARTSSAAVKQVYSNLEKGSRNHLRSFMSNLTIEKGGYIPSHLDPHAFADILNSPQEQGPAR